MGKGERDAAGKNEIIKYEFTENACADLVESFNWYNSQKTNLGKEFVASMFEELNFILAFPASCRKINKNLRRKIMKKFPFNVYYLYYEELLLIEVVGVIHESRNPKIWKERIN